MRVIGPHQPCFVIAEAGVNHNGSVELALELAQAACDAGADAVKFQIFRAEELVAPSASKAAYQQQTTGAGSQLSMLRGLELDEAALLRIRDHCRRIGIACFASVFDLSSVEVARRLGFGLLKLGSGEITNRPLIEACARTGLPLILSTGASTLGEVSRAVGWHQLAFRGGLIPPDPAGEFAFEDGGRLGLMHCVSAYPAAAEDLRLRAMHRIEAQNAVCVGFSDHTSGIEAAPVAVAAGACVVEKHLTLDCGMEGPDHAASLEPVEFRRMVEVIRRVEVLLGPPGKQPAEAEGDVLLAARKSLAATRDLPAGHVLGLGDVAVLRPGPAENGFAPYHLEEVIGKTLLQPLRAGQALLREGLGGDAQEEPSWFAPPPPRDPPK